MTAIRKADQLVNDIEDILTKSSYDKEYKIEQLAKIVIDEILSNFDTNYDHWFWKGVRKEIVNYNYDYDTYDISKMETTQTAVEWLMEKYNSRQVYEESIWDEEFQQAKQMEKEQTLVFGMKCQADYIKYDFNRNIVDIYNETYNK